MSGHTPGPWGLSGTSILDKSGFIIADVDEVNAILKNWQNLNVRHWSEKPGRTYREMNDDEGEANAAFIVTACNCHDELLAALIKAKETIHAWHGDIAWDLYQKSPEMKIINAAIAKAEEK